MKKLQTESLAGERELKTLFAAGFAICVLGLSGVSSAQESGPQLEEITVTGTRIRTTDGMAAPTPVTTLTPDELDMFEPGGTVAEQLDGLPQFFSTGTAQRGGAALFGDGGGSYLNLRGLGRERTLVLFDGVRIVPADKRGNVNVDNIPMALVRSVDVVTGGASAQYGADALGGVTNFILDREYEGLKVSASTGFNEFDRDGGNWNFSVAGGKQFGEKLNVIGSVEARRIDQINREGYDLDSDWFNYWGLISNPSGPGQIWAANVAPVGALHPHGLVTGVAATSALYQKVFLRDGSGIRPLNVGDPALFDGTYGVGGTDVQILQQTLGTVGSGGVDGSEVVNRNAFLGVKYEVSDSFEVFGQVLRGHVESNSKSLHSGATMSGPWSVTVFGDNAFLPQSVSDIIAAETLEVDRGDGVMVPGFRMAKGGSYLGELDIDTNGRAHNAFDTTSWTVGFDALLPNGWDLNFRWQTGKSEKETAEYGSLRVDRLLLAMDAVEGPSGEIVCRVQLFNPTPAELAAAVPPGYENSRVPGQPLASPIGLDNTVRDCVPFNIMGSGQITPEAANYIMTPKKGLSEVEQDFAEIILTGELFEGFGAGPVSFATGLTYREQSFTDGAYPADVDALGPPINAPSIGIQGIAAAWAGGSPNLHQFSTVPLLSGDYDVTEWFGELNIPIWESSAGQQLGASLAFRTSDYSTSGRVESWKVGVDFQIIEDLRFRATHSRDVREPNFLERTDFGPGGGPPVRDRLNPIPGHPVFGTGRFATITYTNLGTADLVPEFSDTTVLGFVYEPSWLDGLRMSLDWYSMDIEDSINALGAQRVIDGCYGYGGTPQDTSLCQYIERNNGADPNDPSEVIVRVFQPYLNFDQASAEGVDLELSYSTDVDFFGTGDESLAFRLIAGKLNERSDILNDGTRNEFAGSLNGPGPTALPDITANLTAIYRAGPWSIQLQERYIDETLLRWDWEEGVDVDDNTVDAMTWTNLRVGLDGDTVNGAGWSVALNIQNLFDDHPPIIPFANTRFNAQSVNNIYDVYGRRYQLTLNFDF